MNFVGLKIKQGLSEDNAQTAFFDFSFSDGSIVTTEAPIGPPKNTDQRIAEAHNQMIAHLQSEIAELEASRADFVERAKLSPSG